MTFQTVNSRIRSTASVAAELLTGLGVLMDHIGLHAIQDRRVAEQVVQLTVEGHLAYFRFLVVVLLRDALTVLVCKDTLIR